MLRAGDWCDIMVTYVDQRRLQGVVVLAHHSYSVRGRSKPMQQAQTVASSRGTSQETIEKTMA